MKEIKKPSGIEKKEAFWSRHIEVWTDSGISITDYCELEDLSKNAFGYWRRKLASPKAPVNGFVEIKPSADRHMKHDGLIYIHLQKGTELGFVPGTDTRYLAELVNALERC
jgi:hypothetical protein